MLLTNLKRLTQQYFYDSLRQRTFNIAYPRLKIVKCKYLQYHSMSGVYGYKPNKINKYEVPKHLIDQRVNNSNFYRFVLAYREHGHQIANINPIAISQNGLVPELNPQIYGLNNDTIYPFHGILATQQTSGKLEDAIKFLENCYCNTLSAEFCHLEEQEEREWWTQRFEQLSLEELEPGMKIKLASELLKSEAFDNFLGVKFVTLKRYGGEGAESMMGFFLELFQKSVEDGIQQVLLGLPHRGRLNILTGLLEFPPAVIFRKIRGLSEFPETVKATGDVLSHLTSSVDLKLDGGSLHVTVLYNPSHLEAVNPVSMGKTRARQQTLSDGCYSTETYPSYSVLNVQVHGDAAFAGQGINQETLAMSKVPHFEVGGSIHLIVNNQIGFTTPGERGRSSRYSSDLAKMINAPVLHVNGDCPEMVVKATRIAFEYQRKFHKDVFIDLNCFRRWGHNEVDDPTFTNPAVYNIINSRRSVPVEYATLLDESSVFPSRESIKVTQNHTNWLNSILKSTDENELQVNLFGVRWSGVKQAESAITTWDTGVDLHLLQHIGLKSVSYPESFNLHPHLKKVHIKNRIERLTDGTNLDWATAESLAIGSLLYQGFNVRISGQDVGRGTFSHRHVMLIDQVTNEMYIPLNNVSQSQMGYLEVANSILSEEAVLGFEYGMSIENPNRLVIWEAQFGDFMNGAQIQIDTFISSGETKWMTCSGIVMLLPHGYDGAGPEHSSCRMERFLQLTDSKEDFPDGDDVNMHLVYPTTPAQYFHILRGQVIKNFRKPLIVVAPKILLRLPEATSSFADMVPQTTFFPVIGDKCVDSNSVQKVIFVTGKHFYELDKYRKDNSIKDVAIVRLEGLSPFPTYYLQQEISKYKKAKLFIWSQEEPQNMGAWNFVFPRFLNQVGVKLSYVGRPTLAAPAVGIGKIHQKEAKDVITQPFIKK